MIGLALMNMHMHFLEEVVSYECKKLIYYYLKSGWDRT